MAVITQNKFFDELTISAVGEAITITNGATLTVRKSLTGLHPGAISCNWGNLVLSTTGVGAVSPIVFYTTGAINITKNGSLISRGDWYTFPTSGDGTDFQTLTWFTAQAPPFLRVETGNNTNQWVTLLNLGCTGNAANQVTGRALSASSGSGVGNGATLGSFFEWKESTSGVRFGSSLTGYVPANGARIQCPSVFITSTAAYNATLASRQQVTTANTGTIDLNLVSFSDRWYLNQVQPKSVKYNTVGAFSTLLISECYDVTFNNLYVAPDRTVAAFIGATNLRYVKFNSFTGCRLASWNSIGLDVASSDNILIQNCDFISLARKHATNTRTILMANCNNVEIYNSNLIGAYASFSTVNNLTLSGIGYSDIAQGVTGVNESIAFPMSVITLAQCTNVIIDRLRILRCDSGRSLVFPSAPYTGFLDTGANSSGIILKNIDEYGWGFTSVLATAGLNSTNITIARCSLTSLRTGLLADTNAVRSVYLKNISTTGVVRAFSPQSINGTYQGVSMATIANTFAASYDSPFYHTYDINSLSGKLVVNMTPPTSRIYFQSLSGSPLFNNNGALLMQNAGDQCEFTWDWKIQSVSAFQDKEPTLSSHFTSTTGIVSEYAIRSATSTTYGDYKKLYKSNLTGEVLDRINGFYMKLRFTTTATSSANVLSNSISSIHIPILSNSTITNYPVGYVPIEIQNTISGSRVWVYNNTTREVLSNETSTGGSVFISAPYDFDGTNVPITVRARYASITGYKYQPFETQATYNKNGSIIFVSQIVDSFA